VAFTVSSLRSVRTGASVLLGLFLATQVGAFWHHATERHAICAEHGDVVELGHGGEDGRPGVPVGRSPMLGSASDGDSEHAHCELLAHRRDEHALVAAVPTVAITPAAGHQKLSLIAEPAQGSLAILRFAPKSSPPL